MVSQHDRTVIRDLASRVAEIASLPIQALRRNMWQRHNRLERIRPMILVFPEGAWTELLPESILQCVDRQARAIEAELRRRIYTHEHFADDSVIDSDYLVRKAISHSGWGLEPRRVPSTAARGAWTFDPVIKTPADLAKLRMPVVSHDEEASQAALGLHQELFGDILAVRLKGIDHISFHLMQILTGLRGLLEVMMDLVEQPAFVHDTMAFLEEGNHGLIRQYADLGLLTLNNGNVYHSSGGVSFSTELPRPGRDPQRPRLADLWASAETQEFAQVSPAMHEEFALQYERRLLAPFGLAGYGCCEDLTNKLDLVFSIPNMRRISISPFADVHKCAEKLGNKYIFSWKPHPSHVAGAFDPDLIRRYIRHTLEVTGGCVIEMILKDTHTCDGHPERFDIWTRIARELVEES